MESVAFLRFQFSAVEAAKLAAQVLAKIWLLVFCNARVKVWLGSGQYQMQYCNFFDLYGSGPDSSRWTLLHCKISDNSLERDLFCKNATFYESTVMEGTGEARRAAIFYVRRYSADRDANSCAAIGNSILRLGILLRAILLIASGCYQYFRRLTTALAANMSKSCADGRVSAARERP